jgi:hypothetical protein
LARIRCGTRRERRGGCGNTRDRRRIDGIAIDIDRLGVTGCQDRREMLGQRQRFARRQDGENEIRGGDLFVACRGHACVARTRHRCFAAAGKCGENAHTMAMGVREDSGSKKVLKAEKFTLVFESLPDRKMRVGCVSWTDSEAISDGQVLEGRAKGRNSSSLGRSAGWMPPTGADRAWRNDVTGGPYHGVTSRHDVTRS